jgi:hypothetical protein
MDRQHLSVSSNDVDSQWKALAQLIGLIINDDTNTKIIVDDIFSWFEFLEKELSYMECQLRICQAYRLSLSLKKVVFSPSASSLSESMFVQTETVLPCQSINSLYTGLYRNLSGMLQNLSGLHNSTENSSLNLNFEFPHVVT